MVRVAEPVSIDHDIMAVVLEYERRRRCPIIFFDKVGSHDIPVVCNVVASRRALAFALGVVESDLAAEYARRIKDHIKPVAVSDEAEKLFRDVNDHVLRVQAQVRSIEDLSQGVLDLTQSVQADTLNEINKKLTGWAAIIAAPALIVGLYGINYHLLPQPTFLGAWGFVMVLGLMGAASLTLYLFFKRKGWI